MRLTPERSGIALAESTALAAELMASRRARPPRHLLVGRHQDPLRDGVRRPPHRALHLARARQRPGSGWPAASSRPPTPEWCLERGADFVTVGTAGILHHDFARRALADPAFAMTSTPVTREHLRTERLGADFIEYLATGWDDLVA